MDYSGTYDDISNAALARTPPGPLTLQVWYAPQVKRMIKAIAITGRGSMNLLVELESYQVR